MVRSGRKKHVTQCAVCQAEFPTAKLLGQHCLLEKHDDDLCCRQCFIPFGSTEALLQHMLMKGHSQSLKSLRDSDTSFSDKRGFDSKIVTIDHEASFSRDGQFQNFSAMAEADRNHDGFDVTYFCLVCQAEFPTQTMLVCHSLTQRHEAELCCLWCLKKFRMRADYDSHIALLHSESEDYTCNICEQVFHDRATQDNHMQNVAEGLLAGVCCEECHIIFGTWNLLEIHKGVHEQSNNTSIMGSPKVVELGLAPLDAMKKDDPASQPQDPLFNEVGNGDFLPKLSGIKYRGNKYEILSLTAQQQAYARLKACVHPQDVLVKENYTLDVNKETPFKDNRLLTDVGNFQPTPKTSPDAPKRKAVVLNCKMMGVQGGHDDVTQICAMDLLTGDILVHSYVFPEQPITEWRFDIHGTTPDTMTTAVLQSRLLWGWKDARAELWKYIDADTILVGQEMSKDLQALHIVHTKVVDSAIITSQAILGENIRVYWSLEELCFGILGFTIRQPTKLDLAMHDNVEDVLSTRELVLKYLMDPTAFRERAADMAHKFWRSTDEASSQSTAEPVKKCESQKRESDERKRENEEQKPESEDKKPGSEEDELKWDEEVLARWDDRSSSDM